MLAVGVFCLVGALGLLLYLVLQPTMVRVAPGRRMPMGPTDQSALGTLGERLSGAIDGSLHRGAWSPVRASELELAGIGSSVGTFLVTVLASALAGIVMVTTLTGSALLGVIVAVLVPVGVKVFLSRRVARRRADFEGQLDATVQLLASALRAGHSLPSAMLTTASESPAPTGEEFGRLVNESRIGRDLVDAMHTTADRMDSEDFHWIAEAVAVQRETGGNLNEVLDRVGETIRDRNALRREIVTLSAEGRMSGHILMALPLIVAGGQMLLTPESARLLYTTTTGQIALAVCAVLYGVAALWMRVIARVKI